MVVEGCQADLSAKCDPVSQATPALQSGPEWMPIETAPSDGRPIIVYGGRHKDPTMVPADGEWWRSTIKEYQSKAAPTHWRLMPLPPQAQISDEERSDEVEPASNSASLTP